MGYMDDFATAYVSPQLEPGESIHWIGCLMRPTKLNALMVPHEWEYFFGVGTDRRLIVVEAVTERFSLSLRGKLEPQAGSTIHVWWYDELGEVHAGQVAGLTSGRQFYFDPFVGCGPLGGDGRRYDIFGNVDGFAAQKQLGEPYMQWLQQGVAQRAFPIAPHKQAYLPALAQQWAVQRQERAVRATASAALSKKLWRLAGVALALVIALSVSSAISSSLQSKVDRAEETVAKEEHRLARFDEGLDALQKDKRPLTECAHEKSAPDDCICRSTFAVSKYSAADDLRKLDKRVGMMCYDRATLRSSIQSLQSRLKEDRARLESAGTSVLCMRILRYLLIVCGLGYLGLRAFKMFGQAPPPQRSS